MDSIEARKEYALKSLLLEMARACVRTSQAIGVLALEHPENDRLVDLVGEMGDSSNKILEKMGEYFDVK